MSATSRGARPGRRDRRGAIGRRGERWAALWLWLHGWPVVARNVRVGKLEIDLVARRGHHWRVVEVRTTTSSFLADPTFAADPAKIARVHRAASQWSQRLPASPDTKLSVDLIAVRLRAGWWPKMRWLRDLPRD